MAEEFPHYIEFRHVYKTFDKPVLVDCSFHVDVGQTVCIIGRSGVAVSERAVSVAICGTRVFEHEQPTAFEPAEVAAAMQGDTIVIDIELGAGLASAIGWGCDLSAEYVSINADYHT